MRKILFKGKTHKGEWIEGCLTWTLEKDRYFIREQKCGIDVEVIHETVGQFTGLFDKNKTKIFPDDLMKSPEGDIFRIYQVDGGFAIKAGMWLKNTDDLIPDDALILIPLINPQLQQWIEQCEVIGNIHDNPELL